MLPLAHVERIDGQGILIPRLASSISESIFPSMRQRIVRRRGIWSIYLASCITATLEAPAETRSHAC
jgi:hypothetical protein